MNAAGEFLRMTCAAPSCVADILKKIEKSRILGFGGLWCLLEGLVTEETDTVSGDSVDG